MTEIEKGKWVSVFESLLYVNVSVFHVFLYIWVLFASASLCLSVCLCSVCLCVIELFSVNEIILFDA